MFAENYMAVRYTDRAYVLHHLKILMKNVLLPEERQLVLWHCGVGVMEPIDFNDLTKYFHFASPENTRQRYDEAIRKIRCAIPENKLSRKIVVYSEI